MFRPLARTGTVVVLLASTATYAQDLDDDTALARTHFEAGTGHFERGEYDRALAAFEEAYRLRPLPALEYDIATCYERLGNARAALTWFGRFLADAPSSANTPELQVRIHALQAKVDRDPHRYVIPGVVGGVALALGLVGAGLVGSIPGPLHTLDAKWTLAPTVALQDQAHALRDRSYAGYAVFGAAGVTAIVDVALWVRAAHRSGR